ncbi:MAG: tetratricopeptide repeat protein [Armatimonadetes bacterium]|nr:tetratricopeptide repeat protein [Armatimonadota bacterium]
MGAMWRVEMLGTYQLRSQGRVTDRFRTRRVAALLAFLTLSRNHLHSRDEVAELLWPDLDPGVARRNLRQALFSLRQVIEPPEVPAGSILRINQAMLSLNPEAIVTDVAEFERLANRARDEREPSAKFELLREAIALYRGPLMPGFDDDWLFGFRFELEDLYLSLLGTMIESCEAMGRSEDAIHYLRLALAKEPLNEDWHVDLMRHYLEVNRPTSAVQQYEELERILRQELDCEPDDPAQGLVRRARAMTTRSAQPATELGPVVETESEAKEPSWAEPSLPVQITRFFGREAEIDMVANHFRGEGTRLLTLLGPAGTGKTRLSIEVGRALMRDPSWKVWFVSLAEIENANQILDRVLSTLAPRARVRQNPIVQIREAVKDGRALVILDNFEHLVDNGALVVADLLHKAPEFRCIVTSRQVLGIEGESQVPLAPLPVPDDKRTYKTREEVAHLAELPSIQMMLDRCQAIRPDVQLTLNNARHFAAICHKLEGIPLAIEIAAGLSSSATPAQIVRQLDNRLAALTSRRRDVTPRHRSLRAAIDYGYECLSPKYRRLFASLSIFRGGFSIESSFAVCAPFLDPEEPPAFEAWRNMVLDLQERSLVATDECPIVDEMRFRMLETLREYGEEVLSSDEAAQLRASHAQHFLQVATKDDVYRDAEARGRLTAEIECDYQNFFAALDWLAQDRQLESAIRLLVSLSTVWDGRGTKASEEYCIRHLAQLAEFHPVEPKAQMSLLRMLGTTHLRKSEFRAAYQACKRSLEVALATDDRDQIAAGYFGMALCAGYLGEVAHCIDLCEKTLEYASATNGVVQERTYVNIGSALWVQDRLDEAEAAFGKAREVSERFRDGEADPLILVHIAGLYLDQGRFDEAMTLAGEAIRASQRHHNAISLAAGLVVVARYHRLKGNLDAAIATSREALQKVRDVAISVMCMEVVRCHSLILAESGAGEIAVTLIAATQGLSSMEKQVDRRESARALEKVRSEISSAKFEAAWAAGLAMDIDAAMDLALDSIPIAC